MIKELFGWMGRNNNDVSSNGNDETVMPELLTFPASADLADADVAYSYGGVLSSGLHVSDFKDDEKLKIYRELSQDSVIATAIEEIVNSMLVFSGNNKAVNLTFTEDSPFKKATKKMW